MASGALLIVPGTERERHERRGREPEGGGTEEKKRGRGDGVLVVLLLVVTMQLHEAHATMALVSPCVGVFLSELVNLAPFDTNYSYGLMDWMNFI